MARGKSTGTVHQSEKQAPSLAATALDNIPTDKLTRRREFVDHLDQLEIDKKAAANDYAAHVKRISDVFGVDKWVQSSIKKLRKMKTDQRARALRQFVFMVKDLDLTDPQGNLFNDDGQPGGLTAEPDKPVFDKTGNSAAPRSSQTDPVKKLTGAEPPLHVPSPALPHDEALAKLEEAKAAAEAKRGGKPLETKSDGKTPKPPGAVEDAGKKTPVPPAAATGKTPKPPATPKPPGSLAARSAEAAAKSSTVRTSRKPTPEEEKAIKRTADKYITPDGTLPPGDENEDPGNFSVH